MTEYSVNALGFLFLCTSITLNCEHALLVEIDLANYKKNQHTKLDGNVDESSA